MRFFTLILLCFLISSACSEGTIAELTQFGLKERPLPVGDAWLAANHSNKEYCISVKNEYLDIKVNENSCGEAPVTLNWEDHVFTGENHGEFGGGLYLQKKGESKKIELLKENIVSLNVHGSDLYIFTGLAHLSISRGAIYHVDLKDKEFNLRRLTLLPGAPAVL